MKRNQKNIIWRLEKKELIELINQNDTIAEIIEKLNLTLHGANYRSFHERIKFDSIDISSLLERTEEKRMKNLKRLSVKNAIPLEKILVENSTYKNKVQLKVRLIRENILKEECSKCGIGPEWNGEPLVLQLDHINGINNDHRIENLRILCPNCHTQTETYVGKNTRRKNKCDVCNHKTSRGSNLCKSCENKNRKKNPEKYRKVKERPSKEELLELILTEPFVKIGKDFGVSDNAVRKWCKYYGLPYRKKDIEAYITKD